MVEADRYTGEVVQQAAAVRAALREVSLLSFQRRAADGIADIARKHERGRLEELATELMALLTTLDTSTSGAEVTPSGELEPAPDDQARRVAAAQQQIAALLEQEPTNVLLVEDDPIAAEILKTGLDQLGCSVAVAATGEEALTMLKRQDCAVDWLLADIVLPGRIDGWTVGQEFRDRNPYGQVVFISAYEQKDMSRKTPGSAFLAKPVRPAQVMTVFRGLESAA